MAGLDPQVQIRIIELAWKYAENTNKQQGPYAGKTTIEIFDEAYKAIVKTVAGS
jgi:hypothetical protein